MPHPAYFAHPLRFCARAIPETCLPGEGEGAVLEIDKIFWEIKQASRVVT